MKSGEIYNLYFDAFFLSVLQQPAGSAEVLIFPALSAVQDFNGSVSCTEHLMFVKGC